MERAVPLLVLALLASSGSALAQPDPVGTVKGIVESICVEPASDAECQRLAVSGTGDARCRSQNCLALAPAGNATGAHPASALGGCREEPEQESRPCAHVNATGPARGHWLAVSGTNETSCQASNCLQASGTGNATLRSQTLQCSPCEVRGDEPAVQLVTRRCSPTLLDVDPCRAEANPQGVFAGSPFTRAEASTEDRRLFVRALDVQANGSTDAVFVEGGQCVRPTIRVFFCVAAGADSSRPAAFAGIAHNALCSGPPCKVSAGPDGVTVASEPTGTHHVDAGLAPSP